LSVVREADLELLAAVLAGVPRAWEHFIRRFGRLIESCVRDTYRRYRVLAGVSDDDVADGVQDVYLDLLRDDMKKLRMYDRTRGKQLSSWLGLIASRLTIQKLRECDPVASELPAESDDLIDRTPQPDEAYYQLERRARAERALAQLSPREREIVLLPSAQGSHHSASTPITQYAEKMNMHPRALLSQRQRILTRLQKMVAE
jgi:RNA polymerase sigma factor (sigma-70 family)